MWFLYGIFWLTLISLKILCSASIINIIKLLENLLKLLNGKLHQNISLKESDVDDFIIIYKALILKKSKIYKFYQFFHLKLFRKVDC